MSGEIDAMIASMLKLSTLEVRGAQLAAPFVEAAVQKTASRGQTPEGETWAPTKDGGRAMPNAAKHITAKASTNTVRVTLEGPDVFHNFSKKKGEPRRRVIPDAPTVPGPVAEALRKGLDAAWTEAQR